MPEKGSCTDITCDNEIKELYECHCCLRLVCFYHLSEHIEIVKENKQQLDSLRNELNTVVYTLKLIIEEKLSIIEREQNLTEQDEHVNEEKKPKQKPYRRIFRKCPLTFNGAYGLTEANHSIEFCEHGKTRRIELYSHFIHKHQLKKIYVRRLVRAVVDDQDPRITKLFDGSENVINHFYKIPCPICCGQINSSEYTRQNIVTVPCQPRLVPLHNFKQHLQHSHKISNSLAQKLVDSFKQNSTKNDIDLTQLIPSTSSK
ncbi:unnamed protein product [Rotaria sp. Silwood1]|nr:unnamed protein product [Rotaria sp. Silwood1]